MIGKVSRNGRLATILVSSGALFATGFACARHGTDAAAAPASAPSSTPGRLESLSSGQALSNVAEGALPSVVSVASTRVAKIEPQSFPFDIPFFHHLPGNTSPFPFEGNERRERVEHGLGSGVLVGKDTILTNAHVIAGASELEITTYDKKNLKAKVLGSDSESDLAVLKITSDTSGLSPLKFADSSLARRGQIVLAIGNPFGVGETVTMGIISARGRADLGIEPYEDFIQTDAAINPGNSGGALVDLDGALIGIPTAILSRSGGYMGIGFAIPSNMAQPIMKSLIEHGHVDRGFLGVGIQNIDQTLATALGLPNNDGVLVSDVQQGEAGAKAGVQRGDVIVNVNGKAVRSTGELRNAIAANGAGKTVKVEIVRQGKHLTLPVTLGSVPQTQDSGSKGSNPTAPAATGAAGLKLAPLTDEMRRQLDVPTTIKQGVVVQSVDEGSAAEKAGIQRGDVIVELDKKPATSPADVVGLWQQTKGAVPVLLFRDSHTFYAVLEH
jgi:serine protease Do